MQGDFDHFKAHDEIVASCHRTREDVHVKGDFDHFKAHYEIVTSCNRTQAAALVQDGCDVIHSRPMIISFP